MRKLENLLRKARLQEQECNKDLPDLQGKMLDQQTKIEKCLQKKKDPIDAFIEWTRIKKRIQVIVEEQKTNRLQLLQKFPDDFIKNQLALNTEGSSALYLEPKSSIINISKINPTSIHPLNSPLVHLISNLGKKGLVNKHYIALLHFSDRETSNFETGVLKLIGIAQSKLISKTVLKDLDSKLKSTTFFQGNISEIEIEYPDYYNNFKIPETTIPADPIDANIKRIFIALVMRLAHGCLYNLRETLNVPEGHPIACMIISKEGKILSWAVNTIGPKKLRADIGHAEFDDIRHAEVNALNIYSQRNQNATCLPDGALLFTSLKPCCMCAGAIFDSLSANNVEIIYCQKDPGENALTTILEKKGLTPTQASFFVGTSDLLNDLNKKFQEIKKDKPLLNAAESLNESELGAIASEFTKQLDDILKSASEENKHYVQYIREFLDINDIARSGII